METHKILKASTLEILFDGRNKDYGAYQLRMHYIDRMRMAVGIMAGLVLVFTGTFFLARGHEKAVQPLFKVDRVHLEAYKKPKTPEKVIPVINRPAPAPKLEMHKLAIPKITPDHLVTPAEIPPKQTDRIKVGPVTQHGIQGDGLLASPPEMKGVGTGTGLNAGTGGGEDYTKEFFHVETEATYPGGKDAWKKYLERNLRQQTPIDNGAVSGLYAVVVSFLVARDGSTSEIKVVQSSDPDYGTAAEAVRVIERSGKWNPAIQNGRAVTYREKQRIVFQVE